MLTTDHGLAQAVITGDLDILTNWLDALPNALSLDDAHDDASALMGFIGLGTNFVHLMRYCLGALALRVKAKAAYGSDPIGRCAETWRIHPNTLRYYASAARRTNSRAVLFHRFLEAEGTTKTIEDVGAFAAALEDRDVTPEAVAQEIRAQRVEQGLRLVEDNMDRLPAEEHESIVVALAHTLGVEVTTIGVDEVMDWLSDALACWQREHHTDTEPAAYQTLVRWIGGGSGS